jgi:hypothetical protein
MFSKSSLLATASLIPTIYGFATEMSGATYLKYSAATYNLVAQYTSSNFFSEFSLFSGSDPTDGYVNYVSNLGTAENEGLVNTNNGQIYLGVDHTTTNPAAPGRNSVRVTSNQAFTHGLFIADIAHMPGSICGVWPAFWLFGPNWPNSGEIDVIEGVNLAGTDQITLHTASGCNVNIAGSQSGTTLSTSNCNSGNAGNGCSASTTTANAYGNSFNNNGGGVYAMQWESSGVYVWFWDHAHVPADVKNGAPVTGNWGLPIVAFNGGSGCNFDSYFANENIVFDTTFCGQWAGNAWTGTCASYASTCDAYVAANPGAFAPAYWLINSIKVYHQ